MGQLEECQSASHFFWMNRELGRFRRSSVEPLETQTGGVDNESTPPVRFEPNS
jgi:hypothetical protein